MDREQINWAERVWVRYLGGVILRQPPKECEHSFPEDHVMAFHFCRTANEYHFDRHFDLLSCAEGFTCGACNTWRSTRLFGMGSLAFHLQEYWKVAKKHRFPRASFWRYMLFGLGDELPENRDGKTSGELEFEARFTLSNILLFSLDPILKTKSFLPTETSDLSSWTEKK